LGYLTNKKVSPNPVITFGGEITKGNNPEHDQIEALNQALKQAIVKELQKTQNGIFESRDW